MKLCFFHSQDNDGYVCAAIYKYAFRHCSYELVPYTYGDKFPDINANGEYYFADVTIPIDKLKELTSKVRSVTICDHHVSAKKDYDKAIEEGFNPDNLTYCYDNTIAGYAVLWKHLFPDQEIPLIIRALGVYDS